MKADLVFNDLSVVEADSIDSARNWFSETLSAVAELIAQKVCNPVLYANQDLYEILLTDDYGFYEWLDELDYQDDLRLLAQQLTTRKREKAFPAHRCMASRKRRHALRLGGLILGLRLLVPP